MTVPEFVSQARTEYREYGPRALRFTAENFFHGLLSRLGFWANYGTDVYEREWDLLILVDACRWDLMIEILDEYEYIESSEPFFSCASHSREWLHKTFKKNATSGIERLAVWGQIMRDPDDIEPFREKFSMKDMSETAYISWNMFTEMLDPEAFRACEEVGRKEWPPNERILEPRTITDRTIRVMREEDPKRTIAHYMQPHNPFPDDDGEGNVWERVQRGEKDFEEAWQQYGDNLRWVMDDIEILLENVDAEKVVISSDHGNAIGEWRCYGHRPYVPLPIEKRVPWLTTSAEDTGNYVPNDDPKLVEIDDKTVEERLEVLGYK